jgi:hypothetical protein
MRRSTTAYLLMNTDWKKRQRDNDSIVVAKQ